MNSHSVEDAAREPRPPETQRLDAFVDSAFAFAVSLLIIAGAEPLTNVGDLMRAMGRIPAFAISFLLVIIYWLGHREYGRHVPRRDTASVVLSLAIVFTVLVYVFPLRVLTESGVAFFSGGRLPGGDLIQAPGDLSILFGVYGAGSAILGVLFIALFHNAAKKADAFGLDDEARRSVADWRWSWTVVAFTGLLSAGLAQVLPMPAGAMVPGFVYWLIPIGIYGGLWLRNRKRDKAPQPQA